MYFIPCKCNLQEKDSLNKCYKIPNLCMIGQRKFWFKEIQGGHWEIISSSMAIWMYPKLTHFFMGDYFILREALTFSSLNILLTSPKKMKYFVSHIYSRNYLSQLLILFFLHIKYDCCSSLIKHEVILIVSTIQYLKYRMTLCPCHYTYNLYREIR